VYTVLGETAAPGGQLFGLAVLCIAAHFGGWLMSLTTLPPLIGMLMVGILFQNVGLVHIEGEYLEVVSELRYECHDTEATLVMIPSAGRFQLLQTKF
jgi:hypothetical protein